MRWKNPLSSGLKRSIETLPDRVMQGFGVGMEISRMRAAREQAAQDRANEAARYRQETARRTQERQQDIDWRTKQAKTSGEQWAAEQGFRQRAFDAQQAQADYERKAREAAAAREAQYAPLEEQRRAEKHASELELRKSQAAGHRARAQASRTRTQQMAQNEKRQAELTRQFAALSAEASRAQRAFTAALQEGDEQQQSLAFDAFQEAQERVKAAGRELGILENYHRQIALEEVNDLNDMLARPSVNE